MSSMLAAQIKAYSRDYSTFELAAVPVPVARNGWAVVKVVAAAVNPVDYKIMGGYIDGVWDTHFPHTLGYDFAGVISALPEGDSLGFSVGDEVFAVNWGKHRHDEAGQPTGGAFAEYILVPLSKLSRKPAGVTFEQAAAVALVGTTAWQALFDCAQVSAGSRILIIGGASSVGSVAVQLAKAKGAWVAATTSTRNAAFVSSLGPDQVINYQEAKWDAVGLSGLDAVIDCVGEAGAFTRSVSQKVLKETGAYVTIVDFSMNGIDPKGHPPLSFAAFFCLVNSPSVQDSLAGMLARGELKIAIEEVHAFTHEGIAAMLNKVHSGKAIGKHVVSISHA
jgi:NADPH:quinone reductase-like Zn-dependent oxidoreductase